MSWHNLQSANDDLQLEQWMVPLHFLLYSLEYLDFLGNGDGALGVSADHAEDVSQLQDEDELLDEEFADLQEDLLEKLLVVVEVAGQHEFWLELHPDRVRLLAATLFAAEKNLLAQVLIKVRRLAPVFSKSRGLLVPVLCDA